MPLFPTFPELPIPGRNTPAVFLALSSLITEDSDKIRTAITLYREEAFAARSIS
jgi:hypothetical protein